MSAENLAEQAAVITCLTGLAVGHPDLPAAYFVISPSAPRELTVQLDSPVEVEMWRQALGVDAALLRVGQIGDRPSLQFDATVYGIDFHVYATYRPAPIEAGTA